jgi:hypothetical protein
MGFILNNTGGTVNSLPGPYEVVFDGGITEANPESGPTAQMIYNVPWDSHYAFAQSLLGQWTGTPPSTFVYTGPYQYPSSTNLMCTSISSIVPYGKPWVSRAIPVALPFLPRQYCRITANFTRPPYQPAASGGYFKLTFSASGEFLTLPNTTYQWADGTPTNTSIGVLIPQAEITITRYKMPFIPDQVMIPLVGTLNNAPFQIGNNTYPTGFLMFAIGNTETEADVVGNITFQVEYKFMYRPVDWNWYFKPDRTTGFALITDGNGNPPYAYSDFSVLP